jgi:hypothetical protein
MGDDVASVTGKLPNGGKTHITTWSRREQIPTGTKKDRRRWWDPDLTFEEILESHGVASQSNGNGNGTEPHSHKTPEPSPPNPNEIEFISNMRRVDPLTAEIACEALSRACTVLSSNLSNGDEIGPWSLADFVETDCGGVEIDYSPARSLSPTLADALTRYETSLWNADTGYHRMTAVQTFIRECDQAVSEEPYLPQTLQLLSQ